jgi:hypothetical protein
MRTHSLFSIWGKLCRCFLQSLPASMTTSAAAQNNVLLGKMVRVTRNGMWLAILVAGCCSFVFAQHGVQEFTSTGTFQVPAGVSTLRVDAYGAGGGGGASDSTFYGGGGGAGAYTAGVIAVSPGEVLTIVIGTGGKGGANPGGAGLAGGATKILNPSKVVLFSANGGKGGQGATSTSNGSGGAGGAGGTFGSIRHAGQNGLGGSSSPQGGVGYLPVGFSSIFVVNGTLFGTGGQGAFSGSNGGNGFAGLPGYILISW